MYNQQIPNINCKLVNTVWIERGIVLTIMYYLNQESVANMAVIQNLFDSSLKPA